MRRSHRGRRYNTPFRIKPADGQVAEDVSDKPSNKESCDIFQEDELGSKDANDSSDVRPQPTRVGAAAPLTSERDWLTRETGAKDLNFVLPPVWLPLRQVTDVEGLGEVLRIDGGGEWLNFRVPNGDRTARAHCGEVEPADAGAEATQPPHSAPSFLRVADR